MRKRSSWASGRGKVPSGEEGNGHEFQYTLRADHDARGVLDDRGDFIARH
jgi:hypothetical protein